MSPSASVAYCCSSRLVSFSAAMSLSPAAVTRSRPSTRAEAIRVVGSDASRPAMTASPTVVDAGASAMKPSACNASNRMRGLVSSSACASASVTDEGAAAELRASGPASNASCGRLSFWGLPSTAGDRIGSARKKVTSASMAANRTRTSGSPMSGATGSAAAA